jgi:hypothetical protein
LRLTSPTRQIINDRDDQRGPVAGRYGVLVVMGTPTRSRLVPWSSAGGSSRGSETNAATAGFAIDHRSSVLF